MHSRPTAVLYLVTLIFLDASLWVSLLSNRPTPGIAALDVGQGDATLLRFTSGAAVLIDAGPPGGDIVGALEPLLERHRIDLVLITHPQLDHFGGLMRLLDRYTIAGLVLTGRNADIDGPESAWNDLLRRIEEKKIPIWHLRARDSIRIGSETLSIFGPDAVLFQSGELNDTGFVARADIAGFRTLLTADIGETGERYIQSTLLAETLRADVLKVAHHGSKYSTTKTFLDAVRPKVALIEVGANNGYHHPTPEALARLLSAVGKNVFRTDERGTVMITHPTQDILRVRTTRGDILERR